MTKGKVSDLHQSRLELRTERKKIVCDDKFEVHERWMTFRLLLNVWALKYQYQLVFHQKSLLNRIKIYGRCWFCLLLHNNKKKRGEQIFWLLAAATWQHFLSHESHRGFLIPLRQVISKAEMRWNSTHKIKVNFNFHSLQMHTAANVTFLFMIESKKKS